MWRESKYSKRKGAENGSKALAEWPRKVIAEKKESMLVCVYTHQQMKNYKIGTRQGIIKRDQSTLEAIMNIINKPGRTRGRIIKS